MKDFDDIPTRNLKYICYILQWFYLPSRVSSFTRKRSKRLILCVKDFKFGCKANAVVGKVSTSKE